MGWNAFVIPLFRDNTRMITSLPVSPSSSPLRRYGPTHQSCFFSPPHPAYTIMGQSSYTLNDSRSLPVRSNATLTLDPWHETSRYKANTPPGGSPRMRFIWVEIVNSYRTKISVSPVVCGWTLKHKLSQTFWSILYTWKPDDRKNDSGRKLLVHWIGVGRLCCL